MYEKVRQYPRAPLKTLVKESSNKGFPYYYSKDIGEGGIFLFTKQPLEIGTRLELNFTLPGETFTISAVGEIVSAVTNNESSGMGVKFLNIGEKDKDIVRKYVNMQLKNLSPAETSVHVSEGKREDEIAIGSAEVKVEVNVPIDFAYKLMCDCERQPEWQNVIEVLSVRERYPDGRPKTVDFSTRLIIMTKKYTLNYTYNDAAKKLSWFMKEGDFKEIKGYAAFEPGGPDKCTLTYYLLVNTGIWIPRILYEKIKNYTLKNTLNDFKNWAEKEFSRNK